MRTSPHIGNSHLEQMNLILEFILNFDVHNLLFAINGKNLDEDEIISLTNDISEYHVKLKKQKQYLFKFCKSFPYEFTSEDNNLVDSSVKVSRRMRSGAAGVKKVFMRFCRISRKQLPAGVPDHQAHEVSLICTLNYSIDLFGLSSYPQSVKDLFIEMYNFYVDMNECLVEGLRTIKRVENIKGDARQCLEILIEACEKSKKNQRVLIEAIMTDPDVKKAVMNNKTFSGDEENPVLKDFKNKKEDVDKITIYKVTTDPDAEDPLCFAKVVFGNDEAKIHRINYVIEHFDELLPEKCKRGKIPAMNLFFFYEWCAPIVGVESFLKYFDKYYKEHDGKWEPIGKSAITGACTKHSKCKDSSTLSLKKEILSHINTMLSEKFPKIEVTS